MYTGPARIAGGDQVSGAASRLLALIAFRFVTVRALSRVNIARFGGNG
jgi:hypothetical protein